MRAAARHAGTGRSAGGALRRALIVCAVAGAALVMAPRAEAQNVTAVLDTLQHTAFDFFWLEANPSNGLIKDRSTASSPSSIAAVGFGLSAICIGSERNWVSRAAAAQRVRTTLETFWNGPQSSVATGTIGYKGFFYHFLNMTSATRDGSTELSTIDTALLMAGVLDARQYFDGPDTTETRVRALADSLYRRVDWNVMRNLNPGIMMGWKPGTGFAGFGQWVGYNEAMILYLLALGSPTHPVPASAWAKWTSGYVWGTQYGYSYLTFPPLFGHQYSHSWVDFRHIQDSYMRNQGSTYFENSRRATLAQRAYCTANPFGFAGYSDSLWGLTAGDGPGGYNARGAPPPQNDDGTIAPTAAISSLPFAPDVVLPAIQNLWDHWQPVWSNYGFKDGFNPTQNWIDTDVLGIDQGPIMLMVENYRTGAVWNRMMQCPEIQLGLERAGFTASQVGVGDAPVAREAVALAALPNPFAGATTLRFELPRAGHVTIEVFDLAGRRVATLLDGERRAGMHTVEFAPADRASGVYQFRLSFDGQTQVRRGIRLQ